MIQTPYLLFLGDAPDALSAKVAQGIKDWRPENAVGQFRMEGCGTTVGLTDMTLQEGLDAGAKTLVIGVANRGGYISDAWKAVLVEACTTCCATRMKSNAPPRYTAARCTMCASRPSPTQSPMV